MSILDAVARVHAATAWHSGLQRQAGASASAIRGAILLTVDAIVVFVTTVVAVAGRGLLPFAEPVSPRDAGGIALEVVVPLTICWLVSLAGFGAYSADAGTGTSEYKRVAMASSFTAGIVGISSYLLEFDLSRGFYVLLFGIGIPLAISGRVLVRRVLHLARRHGQMVTPVLVAGSPQHVDEIVRVLRREPWLGYNVVGALSTGARGETTDGVPVVGRPEDAAVLIDNHQAGAVIFAEGAFPSAADFRRMAWRLEERRVDMIVVPALTDISAERLRVRPVAGLPLVHVDHPRAAQAGRWLKRGFDIIGSAVFLLLASPVMIAAAIAVKATDGGPVFFKQARVGRKGIVFSCLKFRSMCVDAEARLAALQARNEGSGVLFKITDDPRVTRVGKFIRRFSIDELPQLFNVLRGDMSLIGPRPALPTEVARYEPDVLRRLDVRPGLTGLWQVSGRSKLSWEDTVRLDLYYVDNWSIIQDLAILLKTTKAVLTSNGAY